MSLKSSFKGFLGETVINVAMWIKLEKNVYHRLNGITLPRANGGSTQIDHIIVSVYGIFVIETKNYKGWIYGSEKQRQWTQAFPNGSKFKFQNPLRQNYLHIKTLADLLGLELSYFHSMIAFIGECELKTRDELPEHVLTGGMVSYVKKKQDEILTEDEVKSIVEQINSNKFSKSWRTNREHKAYLKDKHSQSNKQPSDNANDKPVAKMANKPILEPIVKETAKRATLKSREVLRWSGQTEIESSDLPIDSLSTQQTITPHNITDKVFLTPFEIVEPELVASSSETDVVIDHTADLIQTPTCPRCNGEMIKRVAKKGARQGQSFYGCAQFPKCRGVVNID
ncbi:NERD domain-containing protein [Psychrobacter sp. N25K4-3-2]|uniref:NERD domain-containing protein n=1 Tax=unclassified Psychrobacter TaxID=196806 RepID=UPI00188BFB4B|nr:NERD domain-containing protein [Psychrobacter sp. N25K4-3-2]MBF4488919.1 NERD domain-containing protein [Psychrobacter sp. N25K4-3-2]